MHADTVGWATVCAGQQQTQLITCLADSAHLSCQSNQVESSAAPVDQEAARFLHSALRIVHTALRVAEGAFLIDSSLSHSHTAMRIIAQPLPLELGPLSSQGLSDSLSDSLPGAVGLLTGCKQQLGLAAFTHTCVQGYTALEYAPQAAATVA